MFITDNACRRGISDRGNWMESKEWESACISFHFCNSIYYNAAGGAHACWDLLMYIEFIQKLPKPRCRCGCYSLQI